MNQTSTIMVAIFIALGVMMVAGLIAIPTIEHAKANNGKHLGQIKNGGGSGGGGAP
jgi:hypothetical protein